MATVTTEHYRAYTPRPFTREERDSVTILFGGLHWRAERVLQAMLEGSGYRARVLPIATKEDLLTGREVADIGQCCPTSFTTGILVTDLVQDLEYQVRPYEVVPGATDAVARESIEYLFQVFRDRPKRSAYRSLVWHLTTGYFTRALREVHRKFSTIEVDRLRVKPTVKITGEFYLQTVEGEPNYNIHRWLESEGAEVYPAAISVWMDYLLRHGLQRFEDYSGIEKGARLKLALGRVAQG